jgi:hypothetical protein
MSREFRGDFNNLLRQKPPSLFMKIKNVNRGLNEFNRGYQSESNFVKYENYDVLADSKFRIVAKTTSLHVRNVIDIIQIEIHTAE